MITTVVYSEQEAIDLCTTVNECAGGLVAGYRFAYAMSAGGGAYSITIDLPYARWREIRPAVRAKLKTPMQPTLTVIDGDEE